MTFTINWNGDIVTPPNSKALWSTFGGKFTSQDGTTTYFPLPISYSSLIPSIGTYTVTFETKDRADLIARNLYGSEEYWWLVYWMNGIIDPFAALNVGDVLLVADLTVINTLTR